ncbi:MULTISPECIES: transposase [Sphingosinicellaceae]|uniref:transposase n=1 Tax=Sphingosinicellaceae TaxID=2820280 RepID=UPI001C1E324B|nr:transposase [Polymorphobacter sp. PAMC 29334]UAJ10966.1 transposase [Polymorphobacter megasporae]
MIIWLSETQICRIEPHFSLSHGGPRVDHRRVINGIIFVIRNCLRWCNALKDYGPHKMIYNRFTRRSRWVRSTAFLQRSLDPVRPLLLESPHLGDGVLEQRVLVRFRERPP